MGCGNNVNPSSGDNCVCAVLRRIADAQDAVSPTNGCTTSCDKSIQDLMNGVSPTSTANTIPVILYCGCEPFRGTGVRIVTPGGSSNQHFDCVNTFVFRVNSVDDDCCARLELLEVKGGPSPDEPCDQFNGAKPGDIEATGICITVDLNCFCAVSCSGSL